jgi:hypothetical protein
MGVLNVVRIAIAPGEGRNHDHGDGLLNGGECGEIQRLLFNCLVRF